MSYTTNFCFQIIVSPLKRNRTEKPDRTHPAEERWHKRHTPSSTVRDKPWMKATSSACQHNPGAKRGTLDRKADWAGSDPKTRSPTTTIRTPVGAQSGVRHWKSRGSAGRPSMIPVTIHSGQEQAEVIGHHLTSGHPRS